MIDALKSYAALASGLTEATAAKARDVATALVDQALSVSGRGTDLTGKVTDLADDLLATSKENREALTSMIRTEVDRAIGRVGFVREDELAALRRHVQRLDAEIASLRSETAAAAHDAGSPVSASTDDADGGDPDATSGDAGDSSNVEVPAPSNTPEASSMEASSAGSSESTSDSSAAAPVKKSKTYIAD
jgi:polyhydroxyalkanoate synthesis regulator phasin